MTTRGSTGSTASTRAGGSGRSDDTSSDVLHTLTEDIRSLVQQELRDAQAELTEKGRTAAKGAAMIAAAMVLGALAAGTSAAVLTRMLETVLPRTLAAALATALFGGAAGMLAIAGMEEIRRALPIVPEETVAGLRAAATSTDN